MRCIDFVHPYPKVVIYFISVSVDHLGGDNLDFGMQMERLEDSIPSQVVILNQPLSTCGTYQIGS